MNPLDRLDDEALRVRAAPFLAGQVACGLRVDVASGVASADELSHNLSRATFHTGRRALHRLDAADLLDGEELGTAVARSAGLPVLDIYRVSGGELYTALPDEPLLLGIDLPDLPASELRAILDRFGARPSAAIGDAALGEWAQDAILHRTDAGIQLRAIDLITGTALRHPGEWAIDGDRLIPLGFPGAWRATPFLDADLSDVESLRSAVDALRPRFVQLRRTSWHDQTAAALRTVMA